MIFGIIEIFGNIVDTSSIYIICNTLFEWKLSIKKPLIVIAILLQSLVMRILNIVIGNSHWIILLYLLFSSYFLCKYFFHIDKIKFTSAFIIFFVLVAIIEIFVTILITRTFEIDTILLQQNQYRVLGILSSKIITFYVLLYSLKIFAVKKIMIEKYSLITLVMMILSLTVFFMATNIYAKNTQLKLHVIYIMVIASLIKYV
jgi:hypothetical protein